MATLAELTFEVFAKPLAPPIRRRWVLRGQISDETDASEESVRLVINSGGEIDIPAASGGPIIADRQCPDAFQDDPPR